MSDYYQLVHIIGMALIIPVFYNIFSQTPTSWLDMILLAVSVVLIFV